jgi:hypothetical protein
MLNDTRERKESIKRRASAPSSIKEVGLNTMAMQRKINDLATTQCQRSSNDDTLGQTCRHNIIITHIQMTQM